MHMLPHYVMKLFDTRHCHVKKIENRLRFDKVTRMSLVSSFFMGRGVVPILSLQHLPRSTCLGEVFYVHSLGQVPGGIALILTIPKLL